MAVFDVEQQRMCVRVVYDGVASAGKTTNLRQLAELFATQRTCELYSPAEMDGRTLYFDWLQIAAGMVCGFPLLCQVITVPGQLVLTPRRRHLLSTADVVVHVCDSDEQAVARALDGLSLFDEVERESGERVPLIIQANKQDQARALAGPALVAALDRPAVPVVEAIAADGIGVIDTFVAAVRAVVRAIKARVEGGKVRVAVQHAERADAVLERLADQEVDPEWAVEMMLEEASNTFNASELHEDPYGATPSDERPTGNPERPEGPVPVFPTEHVPTGFIWPAHTGRVALGALAGEAQTKRRVPLDGEGVARVVVGGFILSTGRDRRFESADAARQALVRAARERTQLGALLAPETVLVAQPAGDDSSWLWTILPRMPTITRLVASGERGEMPRSTLLAAFGVALVDAMKVEATHGLALDLSPLSFGLRQGAVRYVGEVRVREGGRDAPRAVLDALVALAESCDDLEPAVAAIEGAISGKLSPADLARLAPSAWHSGPPALSAAIRDASVRIDHAFERGRKAA